ncbi:zinc finger protein 687a [Melanotaenia boesemani]|uniref:zinc finger protein 687a n=1 Tax=Melanotaenia boesemani TaxID=1250792 RepID=UPI001C048E9C|nr:zinc finger protein 687a [Melanotaenia boesemani]
MGDMKTPDFDDLLAAFDIPDIDAQEAIQSNPEEQRDDVGTSAPETKGGIPPCFSGPAVHQSEPPVVSVIVKNMVRSESLEGEQKSIKKLSDSPSSSALASQIPDLTLQLSPKLSASAAMEPQIANGFEEAAPSNQEQSNTQSWSQSSPFGSTMNDNGGDQGAEPGSVQCTTDVINSIRPLLYPQSSSNTGTTASSPHSSPSISTHLSPRLHQDDDACPRGNPVSSSLPQNGNIKNENKHIIDTDDDSEPDLGSPLVIQESPESVTPTLPKLKYTAKLHSDIFGSPENDCLVPHPTNVCFLPTPTHEPHLKEDGQPTTASSSVSGPQSQNSQDSKSSTMVDEEKYPEHVIDERDSPESPPPSETGLILTNRKSSPDLGSTASPTLDHKELHQQEELMEVEHSHEDKSGDTDELSEKVARNGDKPNEENCDAGSDSTGTCSAAETASSPLRPLKVKIKMPTGSITRTVTGGMPKRSGKTSLKDVENPKPSPELHNTRSKKELFQQLELPVGATLESASSVKEKNLVAIKPKVSPTAVNITKTAALPSVSSSRVAQGAVNLRSLGQKTLNSGMTLPAPLPLLPPQASSKPASIVNSTGAIISKSQTSLVEAFNKILNNKNLLPIYKPDLSSPLPAEWGISLPAQGYRCLECGDAFALEQSLAQHYDRRSLRIEVTCNHCAKRLAFFNKCSLLLHAREHKERGLIMQCSHLVMKPVPVEQMISQQEPASGQTTAKPALQAHPSVAFKKEADTVQYTSTKCPECLAQFGSRDEMSNHFQETKTTQSTPCTECSPPMLLPNSCSAAAHQRIHQSCSPHVCPECGGTVKQSLFQKHLHETCLHFSRRIGYRCSSCLVVFGGLNSVKSHIQQAHCDMFHKCPSCPMAFKSAPSIQSHITSQHPTLTDGQSMYMELIYKCVMCDTVFTHKPLLYAHFDTHLTNQKVHVFKCPECTKLFSQRNSLLDHFKTHKMSMLKEELSPSSHLPVKFESSEGEESMGKQKVMKVKTERMKTPSKWKCSTCNTHYTEREDYITHMGERHGKILKKFPCNKCESSFTTTSSMRRHIRDKHKVMSRGFCCQFCSEGKKTFSSRAMLERHIELRHSISNTSQDTLMRGDEADSSSEQDGSLGSRRRRKAAVKVEQDEGFTDRTSPVKKLRTTSSSAASSLLPESGFVCAPCGFTTENKEMFLEHISQHRQGGTDGGGLQCLQCGACFTSTSSLSRHRFIMHKVREDSQQALSVYQSSSPGNVKNHDYKSSFNGSAPASPSSQPSTGQGKEEDGVLACKVCGKHFEKATDLNTHFRTHGMAFIIARNAGKTT